jgi:hypothetical protein
MGFSEAMSPYWKLPSIKTDCGFHLQVNALNFTGGTI